MEIRDLRYFCLTAEMEHVTKAAEILGISQPFLTRIIGQLEKEIGVPLFDNIGRKIKLNQYGKTFYTYAKKVLTDVETLYSEMDSLIERRERTITIMSNMVEAYYHEMVIAFKETHSNYALSITYATRKDIINALTTGAADFAFCSPPLADDPSKGIKTEIVFRELSCVLLPPDHRLLGKTTIDIEDLKDESLVTSPIGSGLRTNIDQFFETHGYRPNISCESSDMNLIIQAVRNGLGYAVIPRAKVLSDTSLRKYCIDVDYPDAYAEIGMSYNTNTDEIRDISDFRSFAVKFLSDFHDNYYKAAKFITDFHDDDDFSKDENEHEVNT
ncbi:MAG: LysR family transcriptional regulator [Clostridiales bacterium]|nr:LysR family transcriptional regulator [Clostridiales bacterium]